MKDIPSEAVAVAGSVFQTEVLDAKLQENWKKFGKWKKILSWEMNAMKLEKIEKEACVKHYNVTLTCEIMNMFPLSSMQ